MELTRRTLPILQSPTFSVCWFLLVALTRIWLEIRLGDATLYATCPVTAHFLSFYWLCYAVTVTIIFYGRDRKLHDALLWTNLAFLIIPIPPIIDSILYLNPVPYAYAPRGHFFGNLLSFFSMYGDSSVGQRILGIYVCFIAGFAVYLKHKQFFRAALAALALYVYTAFVSIEWIRDWLPTGSTSNDEALYMSSAIINQGFMLYHLLIANVVIMTLWLFSQQVPLSCLIATIRPIRSIHWMLLGVLGIAWSSSPAPLELLVTQSLVAVFSCLLAWWFVALLNDCNDLVIDRLSNSDRLFIQMPHLLDTELALLTWLGISALVASLGLGLLPFLCILLFLFGGVAYSAPPFRFRRYLIGSSAIGIGSALFYIMGASANIAGDKSILENINWHLSFVLLVGFGLAGYIKDEKDYLGDKQAGVATIDLFPMLTL